MANNDNRGFRYKLDNDIDRYANLTEARNTVTGVNERTKFAFIVDKQTLYLLSPLAKPTMENYIPNDLQVIGLTLNDPWVFDTMPYVLVSIGGSLPHQDFFPQTGQILYLSFSKMLFLLFLACTSLGTNLQFSGQ